MLFRSGALRGRPPFPCKWNSLRSRELRRDRFLEPQRGEKRKEKEKSPSSKDCGGKAGRARGLGGAAGRRVGRGEEIALGRGAPWTPPHGGETPKTPKLTRCTHTPSLILPPCPSRHRPSANGSLPPAPGITCRSTPSECGEHL